MIVSVYEAFVLILTSGSRIFDDVLLELSAELCAWLRRSTLTERGPSFSVLSVRLPRLSARVFTSSTFSASSQFSAFWSSSSSSTSQRKPWRFFGSRLDRVSVTFGFSFVSTVDVSLRWLRLAIAICDVSFVSFLLTEGIAGNNVFNCHLHKAVRALQPCPNHKKLLDGSHTYY